MITYKVIAWDGSMTFVTTYSVSDARQQAAEFCENCGGLKSFTELL